jgi:hypothetical protein
MDRFQVITAPFAPFQVQFNQHRTQTFTHIQVLPLWHGSTAAKCDSICRSGFTYFGKHGFTAGGASTGSTDIGFFGSGIYFTTSARYATETYSDGENLLLGWVSLRKPFPVISDTSDPRECSDMKRLKGQGAYHKYNAHYVPVIPDPQNPNSPNYYPCSVTHQPIWDEIVVFQQSQTLVRFWIVLQVDLTHPVPGTHHTIGELLQIISSALDQPPIQAHSQLVQFLEAKETQLLTLPSAQPLTTPDLTLLNIITQLFDDQKNLRSRMVTKLLSPAAPLTPEELKQLKGQTKPAPIEVPVQAPPKAQPVASIQAAIAPALPAWVCGAAEWKKYIGDPGVEPPLPPEIIQRLGELNANNVLVLIPETVNGRPLDLKTLGELVQKPLQGHATNYRYFYLGKYVDRPASKSHWALLTRTVIDGSRNKLLKDEQVVLDIYSQKTKILYEAPTILDATVCNFMEYVRFGTWLYGDKPLTYTWCQEKYNANHNLVVGGGSAPGLSVSYYCRARENYGVGGLRKF